jgi:hypothetical protein
MLRTAEVAVCSETRIKTQRENHLAFLKVKPGGTKSNREALEG